MKWQDSSSRFSGRYSVSLESFLKRMLRTRAGALAMGVLERTPLRRHLYSTSIHPTRGVLVGSGSMAGDWDKRAQESARFYIAPDDWESEEEFERSGEREVEEYVLKDLSLSPQSRVLEIGCGIGRLLRPMAGRFADVHGVDISEEMIKRGRGRLADLENIHLQETDGSLAAFPDQSFDFCYSWRVFLHVPRKEYVLQYFRGAARVLKSGGLFRFDVAKDEGEGRRRDEAGTWFGVVFSEEELRSALEACGLEPLEIRNEGRRGKRVFWENWIVTARRRGAEQQVTVRAREHGWLSA